MCFRTDERRLNVKNCEGARCFRLCPLRVQRLMLEFAGEDDACGGGLTFVWRVRSFSAWWLTLEELLKARLLRHDDVRFQRM